MVLGHISWPRHYTVSSIFQHQLSKTLFLSSIGIVESSSQISGHMSLDFIPWLLIWFYWFFISVFCARPYHPDRLYGLCGMFVALDRPVVAKNHTCSRRPWSDFCQKIHWIVFDRLTTWHSWLRGWFEKNLSAMQWRPVRSLALALSPKKDQLPTSSTLCPGESMSMVTVVINCFWLHFSIVRSRSPIPALLSFSNRLSASVFQYKHENFLLLLFLVSVKISTYSLIMRLHRTCALLA